MRTYAKVGLLVAALGLAMVTGRGQPAYAWSYPAALNTDAATDGLRFDSCPQVTTDGGGNWVAVWSTVGLAGGTDHDILVARSTDNGATWTAPAALNTNFATDSGRDTDPQVATDAGGNWVAVWHSDDDLDGTIGTDYDILVARSTDNGATWTGPAALNTNAATDEDWVEWYPQVTTDGGGNWVAVWYSGEDLGGTIGWDWDIFVARSTDNGATWTPPAALNANAATDSGSDRSPHVTTDGGGNWVAVWYSPEDLGGTIGTDYDILVARSTDNGASWTYPAALNNAATDLMHDYAPQVTTDGGGNWVAVWHSLEDLGGTIGWDKDILVARSTDNGATWTATAALNTNAATDSGDDGGPRVTTDGAGNWVAVWSSDDDLGGTIGTDSDGLMAHSTDNGATWTDPAALNSNAATDSGDDGGPRVTTDGAGNWVAVWSSDDDLGGTIGTDRDILYATCSPLDADCPGADDDDDGVVDVVDNCPDDYNPDQNNGDGDSWGDACDNCPQETNPDQTNADGDAWGDACDNCPATATPWHVPPGDDDCDGSTTAAEEYVGTDPTDACPDVVGSAGLCPGPSCDGDDCWPPDLNVDRNVNILDVLLYTAVLGGAYDARYDLDASGAVNVVDVVLYKVWLGESCTNP